MFDIYITIKRKITTSGRNECKWVQIRLSNIPIYSAGSYQFLWIL